jgi:hypothetical protein
MANLKLVTTGMKHINIAQALRNALDNNQSESKTMNPQIQSQKDVAFKLLKQLQIVAPSVILAGGAPRDWDHGREASDFDYFINLTDFNSGYFQGRLESLLDAKVTDITNKDSLYYENTWVYSVFEFYHCGVKCNLVVYDPIYIASIVEVFPMSISKIYYMPTHPATKEPYLMKHTEYELGKDYKLIFINDSTKTRYIDKIMDKYRFEYKAVYKKK